MAETWAPTCSYLDLAQREDPIKYQCISAEFPNSDEVSELYNIVRKQMIHGPCGPLNRISPCMKEGRCTKDFPKKLRRETQFGEDGYPKYRRKSPDDGGFTATIRQGNQREITVDNKWVISYSPLLCKSFNAHINVEYCNSIKSIKYVCSTSTKKLTRLYSHSYPVTEMRYQTTCMDATYAVVRHSGEYSASQFMRDILL